MNTVRTMQNSNVISLVNIKQFLVMMLLTAIVLSSAFGVVYMKDLKRHLIGDLESLQQSRETLVVEHGQLLLEQHTWATQARIETLALQIGMESPTSQNIVMVQM